MLKFFYIICQNFICIYCVDLPCKSIKKNTMANLDQAPSRTMPNLLHVLPAFANESEHRVNTIVELNSNTINKYELITETGHLKLDRVGYSSLAYPFAYGCLPRTWDEDGDPLDIEIVNVTEPLVPGSIVEARII